MENKIETVTIKLETYENMQKDLETLRKQVEEKTIYRDILNPIYGYIALLLMMLLLFWITR